MTFPGASEAIPVKFYKINLYITDVNNAEHAWTMSMGFIDETYLTSPSTSGINFDENVLGLAPMTLTGTGGTASNLD